MGQLSLAVLGPPQVRHAGQPLALPTRKALALLIYLAVEGAPQSRETLAALLWPESDEARARGSLRLNLSYLRQALDSLHLQADQENVSLDLASEFELDASVLAAAAKSARVPGGDPALAARAAALYRGDFLEGFSVADAPEFDTWAAQHREIWHWRMSQVFDWLSAWQSEAGQASEAVETAARWLGHDPLNEAAHRRLMRLHLAAGNRSAALLAYDNCRAILARELSAEPSAETEALADSLRAGPLPTSKQTDRAPRRRDSLDRDAPLIGRASEHASLVAAWRAAERGRPQAVALEGEAGIGKTRLAVEFLSWAQAHGAAVLHGRALETAGRLPYQPLVEALRAAESLWQADEQKPSLSATWLAELTRLLPELRDRWPDLPAPAALVEADARARLFEAVARLGRAWAARSPLLIFLDDVQWADAATLDLLSYAARRWAAEGAPVLLVLALRSDDLASDPALTDWLVGLGRELPVTRTPVGPLDAEDTLRLAAALSAGAEGAEDLQAEGLDDASQRLYLETGGHPFYIVETARMLAEGRAVNSSDQASLPARVRALIQSRLSRLGPAARGLASAAAVLGDDCEFNSLRPVAGLEEDPGLAALDELLRRGLLREVPTRPERPARLFFAHDRIREVAYAEAGDARRRLMHRHALEALERAGASSSELARHAHLAGLPDRAFHLSLDAGDEAMRLFAVRDAAVHYQRARELAAGQPREAVAAAAQPMYERLGRALELVERRDEAQAVYEEMLNASRVMRRPVMECSALNRLATLAHQWRLDFEAAGELLHAALAVAEASGDRQGLAETEWNLAQLKHYATRPAESLAHGERALALARELGIADLIARSLNILSYSKLELGRWADAEAAANQAAELYTELGNRALEADSLSIQAEAQIRSGRARVGLATAQAAYAVAVDIDNLWGQANVVQQLGLALLELGEFSRALSAAKTGVAVAQQIEFGPLVAFNQITLGNIYNAMLAVDEAQVAHEAARLMGQVRGDALFQLLAAAGLCASYAQAGRWAEALPWARHVATAGELGRLYSSLNRWWVTETLVRAGERELAEADAQRLGQVLGDDRRYRIPYLRCLAVLNLRQPEPRLGKAVDGLQEAALLAEDLGLPVELWQILAALGEVYEAHGDRREASQARDRAEEIVRDLAGRIVELDLRERFLTAAKPAFFETPFLA